MKNLPAKQHEIIIKCTLEEMTKAFYKDYEIIWHDPNVNSQENQQYLPQFEKLCKVKTFSEWKKAEDYIKTAKTVCHVITSGTNGELLVKEIFSSANVPKIFTFCRDEKTHSTWTKNYEKVLCTETKIEGVILQIQNNLLEWQKQTSSFKFDFPVFAGIFDDSDKSEMNNLHLLLKVIPKFKNRTQAKRDFVSFSKKVYLDEEDTKLIALFKRKYRRYKMKKILRWYTKQSFLYKAINNCLRIATSDSIQYCRLLLKDVERAIKDQYQKKSKNFSGILYRGAYLSEKEWSHLKSNLNKEIEMHGFLSVSKEKKVALDFVKADPTKKVFITIIVPKGPNEEEQGFAEVEEFSEFKKEQEVLFNVRSRFTVLETDDGGSEDFPYRHLVLLYGAQSLRKFVAQENPLQQVLIEGIENISGSRCQGPPSEMTEKTLFKSLRDPTKPIYSCKGCLDPNLAPFLCVPLKGKRPLTIKGCLLPKTIQAQIPLYGYKCSNCGAKNQKGYFVCTDCCENKMNCCENCFENALNCIEIGHSVLLETYPFSFWYEEMSENELNHLKFQNDEVKRSNHMFQQAQMYIKTHECQKAIEYYQLYLKQNEAKGNSLDISDCYLSMAYLYIYQGGYKMALQYASKSLEIYKSIHGEKHYSVANSYNEIGLAYFKDGEGNKALEYLLKSLEIRKSLYGENFPSVASSYSNIGDVYRSQGKFKMALEYYLKSREFRIKFYGENHPDVISSYSRIGNIYSSQGEFKMALEQYFKSLSISKILFGENHPSVADAYTKIGHVFSHQREHKKALEYCLKALEIDKLVYGETHPRVADTFISLADKCLSLRDFEMALQYQKKCLNIRESTYGENHISVIISYRHIGNIYEKQGKYELALEHYFKSLQISELCHVEPYPSIALCRGMIGSVYRKQGNYKMALEDSLKALEITESAHGKKHPYVALTSHDIGLMYYSQGHYEEAFEYHQKSLDIRISLYGENHCDVAASYDNIGLVYRKQEDFNKAFEHHQKSLNIRKLLYGETHFDVAASYNNIGLVYHDQGNYKEALESHRKSLDIRRSLYGENHSDVAKS